MLGSYNPLIWQCPGQDLWTPAELLTSVSEPSRAGALTVDVVATGGGGQQTITAVNESGKQAARERRPTRFRVAHRLIVWRDSPYFASRLLFIENTDPEQVLTLKGYFFYLKSAIGGSPEGDVPAGVAVPNYYRTGHLAVWQDEKAGGRYGCMPEDDRIKVYFWLDKGGGQHPDARVDLDPPLVLKPGQMYMPDDPPHLFIFGRGPATSGPGSWPEVEKALEARRRLVIEVGPRQSAPAWWQVWR